MSIKKAPILNFSPEEKKILLTSFPQGMVALDVESTGLSPLSDQIIELSAVKISPKALDTFDHLIKPEIPIPKEVIEIHGITEKMVQNAAPISSIMPLFLDFIEDLPLIAHNAKYDLGFVITSFHHLNLSWKNSPVYCSYLLAKDILKKTVPNKKLTTLVKHFNLPSFASHRALADAAACLHVYAQCLLKAESLNFDLTKKKSYLFNLSEFKDHDFTVSELLQNLVDKIPLRKPIEIKYQAGSHRNQFRPVKPYALFPLPQGNILYAHCLISDTYKHFYLHKIKEVKELSSKNKALIQQDHKGLSDKKREVMKKLFFYLEKFLLLIAHLLLLAWMIYTLKETGFSSIKEVFYHFLGMSLYGGGLIWFTARRFRTYPRKE